MVTVPARKAAKVERDARAVDEALPELLGELGIEGADPLRDRFDVVNEERPPRQVEGDSVPSTKGTLSD